MLIGFMGALGLFAAVLVAPALAVVLIIGLAVWAVLGCVRVFLR